MLGSVWKALSQAGFDDWVFVDIETTGGKLNLDEITEIALIHVCQGEVVERYQTLIKPSRVIPPWITGLTGISNAMVADAPCFEEVAATLATKFHNKLFVAHNARFDFGFIKAAFKRLGLDLKLPVVCTVKLSRALYPQYKRHGLDQLIERFGWFGYPRHRAMGDAEILWLFIQQVLQDKGEDALIAQCKAQLKTYSLPANLDPEVMQDCPDSPGVYRFYNQAGDVIYIGKSVTLRSRILSHFTQGQALAKDLQIASEVYHLDWIECAGDLGAQLLESKLVKQLSPKYNRQLKKLTKLWHFQVIQDPQGYDQLRLVSTACLTADDLVNCYGLYRSKALAIKALEKRVAEYQLCQRLSGLDKRASGACFAYQLKRCKGGCIGQESPAQYNLRLATALLPLKQQVWPWPGPVLVKEQRTKLQQVHLIYKWCWMGSADSDEALADLLEGRHEPHQIELDSYKILVKFLLKPSRSLQVRCLV
ncbi:GIY-YIG nuclease family protein [Thiomicrospira microaerophila]|uniref:exonuclease domain-containing protein n=1 Tax=Thiomicrospira microaerophila TaxID=406020 RepID=UPI00200C0E4C|nr:exonuclease domain-containing protein [Thiomicrospira microaerophila]UQB43496.1 GIY-YIG nuclease family protein [Thiomicrospira microaerophila]